MTKAGTEGAGISAPVQIYMEAHVRLVRTGDNAEALAYVYRYEGNRLTLTEWSADQDRRLLQALEEAYAAQGVWRRTLSSYPVPE